METNLVYVVTSYGKVMGCYADPKDAFDAQLMLVNKNRLAELVPCSVIPSSFTSKSKQNGK